MGWEWPQFTNDVDREFTGDIDFLVRGGRVVVQPIWKGAFERDDSTFNTRWGSWVDSEGRIKSEMLCNSASAGC